MASFAGIQMDLLVRGWLVYEMTGSALNLGIVGIAFGLPIFTFSFWGGIVADRVGKLRLIIVSQAATGAVSLGIAILLATGAIVWWHFVVAAFLQGVIFAFQAPGRQAFVPELVNRQELLNAIALNSSALNLMRIIAPAIGGILLATIGATGVYYVIVACNMTSVATLFVISIPVRQVKPKQTFKSDMFQGLRFIRHNPTILALLTMAFVPTIFGLPYMYLMPVFAADVLKVGETGLGWLMTMIGVGALAGSLGIASLVDFRHKGLLQLILVFVFGVTLCLFSQSSHFGLSLALITGVGLGSIGYITLNNTLILHNTPQKVQGRVMSNFMMTFGLMPVGALPMGALAEFWGSPLTVFVGGAIVIVFTVAMGTLIPRLRRLE